MASTYMSLTIPSVGVSTGREGANNLVADLNIIDAHDHSPGYGAQITPSGLNINADLSIGSNNLTDANSLRMDNRGSAITSASPNVACLYAVNGELYYNDASGNQVAITSGGTVNAGDGSIQGLPSGTAAVTFSTPTYVFESATNTAASIDVRDVVMRNSGASSYGYTIVVPTLPNDEGLTLPIGPASSVNALGRFITMSTSNVMAATLDIDNTTIGITGSNTLEVKDGSITSAKIANATIVAADISASAAITGSQLSASAGIVGTQLAASTITYDKIADTTIRVSNMYATGLSTNGGIGPGNINTTGNHGTTLSLYCYSGRPVYIWFTQVGGTLDADSTSGSIRVGVQLDSTTMISETTFDDGTARDISPSMFNCVWMATSTGSHTFRVYATVVSGSASVSIGTAQLYINACTV